MKLILFRHGLAMDREEAIEKKIEDSLRPLVSKGKQKTREMARFLQKQEKNIDLIVSSPFVRAMETAEILCSTYQSAEIKECVELVPSSPSAAFAQWLRSQARNATTIVAVGHEPQLSTFATWLLAGAQQVSFFELKKSGIICLNMESFEDIEPKSASISWMVSPKLVLG